MKKKPAPKPVSDPAPAAPVEAEAAPALAPIPGFSLIRFTRARSFDALVTIAPGDLAHVSIGRNRLGANGLGLVMVQGRMLSYIGDFPGDGNPAHDVLIGFPMYVPV